MRARAGIRRRALGALAASAIPASAFRPPPAAAPGRPRTPARPPTALGFFKDLFGADEEAVYDYDEPVYDDAPPPPPQPAPAAVPPPAPDPPQSSASTMDPGVASQFTVRVCTSSNCSRRLAQAGLDQYQILGEMYGRAADAGVHESMVVEEGTCQGGRNCKRGPCVAVQHRDFDGNVALEGMTGPEFDARVFHGVLAPGDADRVWGCLDNAVALMAEAEEDAD